MKLALISALTATFLSSVAFADAPKTYQINFTDEVPVIDGVYEADVWKKANALTDFTFPWRETPPPKTTFRALWDKDALYFLYVVEDKNLAIGDSPTRAILDSDRVEIFLAKDKELSQYYAAEMDLKGRVFSAKASYDMETQKRATLDKDWSWDGLEVKAEMIDNGYQVEGKLPLSTIENLELWQDKDKTQLICALMRAEFTKVGDKLDMGWMTWVDPHKPKPDFHNPETFGACQLVK